MQEEVKIYGNKENEDGTDLSAVLEMMKEHRANGNIDKAKALGCRLSKKEIDFSALVPRKFMKPDIIYQMKVLFVFAAEANIQMLVSSPLLATTAINAMYDEIQKNSPGFYENISDGVAFTFYYTSVKDGGDIGKNIGETFAMLCSVEDNESFIAAGKLLYETATGVITEEIEKSEFSLI